ncbi:hypothetical protein [Vibrio harveyi]|uniref:hypothetical protein n=1 Tax=Vibrio harveyi TaxID=669 RepID=UPI0018F25BB5|nr:hypothetical protein [Vibrio harveyi]
MAESLNAFAEDANATVRYGDHDRSFGIRHIAGVQIRLGQVFDVKGQQFYVSDMLKNKIEFGLVGAKETKKNYKKIHDSAVARFLGVAA